MDYSSLTGGGGDGGGGAGKAASSSSSAASAINFGSGLVTGDGGLTPMAGIILAAISLFALIGLIVVARK